MTYKGWSDHEINISLTLIGEMNYIMAELVFEFLFMIETRNYKGVCCCPASIGTVALKRQSGLCVFVDPAGCTGRSFILLVGLTKPGRSLARSQTKYSSLFKL